MTTIYTLLSAPDSSLQQDAISILQIFDFKNIPYTLEKTSSYWIWDALVWNLRLIYLMKICII